MRGQNTIQARGSEGWVKCDRRVWLAGDVDPQGDRTIGESVGVVGVWTVRQSGDNVGTTTRGAEGRHAKGLGIQQWGRRIARDVDPHWRYVWFEQAWVLTIRI